MLKKIDSEKIKVLLFCLSIAFIILSLTSKCSFLYPFNDWDDANAFFTTGKAMFNGVVPYKDLFEQKGPLLYVIYGIGYLISNKTFLGIFLLEILFWTIALYYMYKIIALFLPKNYAYVILPIFMAFLCTGGTFTHGGSAEEFCMTLVAITIYYFLEHFEKKELNYKKIFFIGFLAGSILMTKYTLLGFWFAFMALIFFDLVLSKKYQKAILSCFIFLLGMSLPFIAFLIYFLINDGVEDFFNVYFLINMTAYAPNKNILYRLFNAYTGCYETIWKYDIVNFGLIILMPYFVTKLKAKRKTKINLTIMLLIAILGIFIGLKFYRYYPYPLYIFGIFSLIIIFSYISKYLNLSNKKIMVISIILSIFIGWCFANYKEMRFTSKKDMFQYQMAEIINANEDRTLVNMGSLDCGLYTVTGIVPTTYFFELQNFDYERFPDNLDSFEEYIIDQKTEFIVYTSKKDLDTLKKKEKELFKNYDLVLNKEYFSKKNLRYAYLFQRKDKGNE